MLSNLLSQSVSPFELHRQVKAEKARRSLYSFVQQGWSIVEPAMPFIDNFHIGAVCEHLTAVHNGEILRLLINMPPGHAKSLLVSVFWPAWQWVVEPSWRGLFGAYAGELALRDSVRCRSLVESAWYKLNFSAPAAWELSNDQNVKSYFSNTKTGFRMAMSVGGKATGFRGNAVVVDDPLNAKEAPSKLAREDCIFWWDKVMSSRLNDMRRGARVIMMQRLHEDDLSGHVIEQGGYEHLCLPSLFESHRRCITFANVKTHAAPCPGIGELVSHEAISEVTGLVETVWSRQPCACPTHREKLWSDPRINDGELLFPELFPETVLERAKVVDLGSEGFAGQHQQRPAPEDGERFKKAWWRFWKHDGAPDRMARPKGCNESAARVLPIMERVIISLDATFKDSDGTDFVVFQVWGCNRADRFLLAQVRARMSFTKTIAEFKKLCTKFPEARKKIVEDKANGSAIIDTLKSEIAGIVAVQPEGGKEARAAAAQPQVESGNVYLPDGDPLIEDFVAEFTVFPNGKNDDQVDAFSQAMLELAASAGATRLLGLANM